MEKFQKLFDSLIRSIPAYPYTIFSLIFMPKRVFCPSANSLIISPAIASIFSIFLGYFGFSYFSGSLNGGPSMFVAPPIGWVVFTIIYFAVVVSAQRLALSLVLVRKGSTSGNFSEDIIKLVYPYAVILPMGATLPIAKSSPEWSYMIVVLVLFGYLASAFNVLRYGFRLNLVRSAAGALICFLTLQLVGGIGFLLLVLPFR